MTIKLGNTRVTGTEQYYTPTGLANELVLTTLATIPKANSRTFLEPAGGTGSFVDALRNSGISNLVALDKYPKHEAVLRQDFLDWQPSGNDFVTISNPPFGRNNALSVPFFNKAADFSDYIAFLVPRSWRKWSVQNRLDLRFHLVLDHEVRVQYENENGEKIAKQNDLRTCFQIWEKQETLRAKVQVPDNRLIAKSTPAEADLAIRVFGYGCGSVMEDFARVENTTLMFLRILDNRVKRVIKGLDYERFAINTAYIKALSFQEINFLLNEELLGNGFLKS
jgi:predicted RNA methylase